MVSPLLSVEDARQRILEDLSPLGAEQCSLLSALHRILSNDVYARYSLPGFDNSAMDGYALLAEDGMASRSIIGTSACGDSPEKLVLSSGQAARIMTGAPVPRGADTVVMQEHCHREGSVLQLQKPFVQGQHIRRLGSDIRQGELLLARHTTLGPAEIAALASQGRSAVSVTRQPVVAVLSTGSELVELDTAPSAGQLVNSNSYALAALVQEVGARPVVLGIVPDDAAATERALAQASLANLLCMACCRKSPSWGFRATLHLAKSRLLSLWLRCFVHCSHIRSHYRHRSLRRQRRVYRGEIVATLFGRGSLSKRVLW
jgi:molybdopterin molybdotransferase